MDRDLRSRRAPQADPLTSLEPLDGDDGDDVVALLSGEPWPFHTGGTPSADDVRARWDAGRWHGDATSAWWVVDDGVRVGLVTVDDLDDVPDGAPLLDVRLREAARGHGLGTAAVRIVAAALFDDSIGYAVLRQDWEGGTVTPVDWSD